MDAPKKVFEQDEKFVKAFSTCAGIVIGATAFYILISLFGLLQSVS